MRKDRKPTERMGGASQTPLPPRLVRLALLVAAFASGPPAALAQDRSPAFDLLDLSLEELGEIELTVASQIPADALNVASTASAISEEAWRRRGARTISDALESVPGVAIAPGLSGADAFAIRGYTRSTSLLGVLLTWDGVPLNDLFRGAPTLSVPSLSLGAVDEIQIVKGPGSALYGADAFHGVVALHGFEAASGEPELRARLHSDGFYAFDTRAGTRLGDNVESSFAFAADGQPDQDRAYRYTDPVSSAEQGGERDNRYTAQTASLKLRGGEDSATWHAGVLLHRYEGEDFQGFGTRLAGTRDVGGIDVDLVVGNGGLRRQLTAASALDVRAYAWAADNVLQAGRTTFDFESATKQRRAGAHATYEKDLPARRTTLAVGAGVETLAIEDARTRNYDLSGALTLDAANPSDGTSRRIYSASFEGNTRWSDDRWRVVYGARYDSYSDFGARFSPRLGLIWHAREDNSFKLLYGNAFRAPTANDVNGTAGLIEANPLLEPEIADTLELVYMRQLPHASATVTMFQSRWRDGIVSIANPGGSAPFVFVNLEKNRARGVSTEIDWERDAWLVAFGASWIRSENSTLAQNYDAFPRFIVDAEVGYRHAAWRTRFYLAQRWQIDTYDGFPPSTGHAAIPLPQYARTDVGAARALTATVSLTVSVRNLFDRENFRSSSAGTRGGIPSDERSFGVDLRFAF